MAGLAGGPGESGLAAPAFLDISTASTVAVGALVLEHFDILSLLFLIILMYERASFLPQCRGQKYEKPAFIRIPRYSMQP